jgi:hypothetical protein
MTPHNNEPVRDLLHDWHPGMRASHAITERGHSKVDHAPGTDLIASVSARTAPNGRSVRQPTWLALLTDIRLCDGVSPLAKVDLDRYG